MANSWNSERDFEETRDGYQQWRMGNYLIIGNRLAKKGQVTLTSISTEMAGFAFLPALINSGVVDRQQSNE